MTTYTLIPPHDEEGESELPPWQIARRPDLKVANDLIGRYGAPRSQSVLKIAGVYVTIQTPNQDEIASATEVYLGGHEHPVSQTVANALTAAGYQIVVS